MQPWSKLPGEDERANDKLKLEGWRTPKHAFHVKSINARGCGESRYKCNLKIWNIFFYEKKNMKDVGGVDEFNAELTRDSWFDRNQVGETLL